MSGGPDLIQKYFPELQPQQLEQFAMLGDLYADWNQRINVISRKDIDALYEHHVLHSLAIAKVVTFHPEAQILDVGTGGGFPGIPLAILFPDTRFHLIDSIAKKLKVVDAVAEAIRLSNVTTQHIRAEQVANQYDFIISRAVAALPDFLPWTKGKFLKRQLHNMPNGMFLLKGGDLSEELETYQNLVTVYPISNFFAEAFFETKKVVYVPNAMHTK